MWYSVNEQLGLKKLSPTAYFLRSAGSTISLLGLIVGILGFSLGLLSEGNFLERLLFALTLSLSTSGCLQAVGCAMMVGWQWILWRRRIEFSFDRDEYVPCDSQPFPWAASAVSFSLALCSNIPLIAQEVYRNSRLSRILLLEGRGRDRTVEIHLQRAGQGWVSQSWPAKQCRISQPVDWSASEGFMSIVAKHGGARLLVCHAQADGSYLLLEPDNSGEGGRGVRLTAKRGIWFPRRRKGQ